MTTPCVVFESRVWSTLDGDDNAVTMTENAVLRLSSHALFTKDGRVRYVICDSNPAKSEGGPQVPELLLREAGEAMCIWVLQIQVVLLDT